jgi:hypothetical protein
MGVFVVSDLANDLVMDEHDWLYSATLSIWCKYTLLCVVMASENYTN